MTCGIKTEVAMAAAKPVEETYDGYVDLGEKLWQTVGRPLGMPHLEDHDLKLLDEAISILSPPEAHVRVVEADTFIESERSIVKGSVPIGHGDYSLRQKTVIFKRVRTASPAGSEPIAYMPGDKESKAGGSGDAEVSEEDPNNAAMAAMAAMEAIAPVAEMETTVLTREAADAMVRVAKRDAEEGGDKPPKLPEIILFWGRSKRRGGNLVVCPNKNSMDRIIQAYLVCEVVTDSKLFDRSVSSLPERLTKERKGSLMGVELGEASTAEQDALENLISDYSFHDASIGIVSLTASIYYFGVLARNDVNVLTLLAVAVVAGLKQEATWPWVFKHILLCARQADPIVRVSQCRLVRHHQGQLSGQGALAIGLTAFGVYLEVWPTNDGDETPLLFRILLNGFQAAMIAVLVTNMVQAVEPIALSQLSPRDRLKGWARSFLDDNVFDTDWRLTLAVGGLWAAIVAVVVTQLSYESEDLGWTVTVLCMVLVGLSLASLNPGMAILGLWGLVWLVPVGLAFVWRSAFDTALLLINRISLAWRRMANEVAAHVHRGVTGWSVHNTLLLLLQVLPLTPLFLVSLPIPFLYIFVWLIHLSMRIFLRVADAIISPVSNFRLHPILSDYGSVTWKMERLTMQVENRSMRALLRARIDKLMRSDDKGSLGKRYRGNTLPFEPYWHLSETSRNRLGCVALAMQNSQGNASKTLLVSPNYVPRKEIETAVGKSADLC